MMKHETVKGLNPRSFRERISEIYLFEGICKKPHDPKQIRLEDFRFRINDRFLYEYDFGDLWQHEIRVEKKLPLDPKKTYPVCTGEARLAHPRTVVDHGHLWRYDSNTHYIIYQKTARDCGK